MVTRVLAETTRVKNNFINEKKNFERKLSCLFGGRRKFKLRICLRGVGSAANSVGKTLEFAASLAEILMSNLAELVPSGFFLSTTMVFAAIRTHFPRKNTPFYRNTVTCVTGVTSNQVKVPRLNSQHLAMVSWDVKHSRASAFRYFLSTTMVFQQSEHISPRKTPVYLSIELRPINSCLSIKMKTQIGVIADVVQWLALSLFVPAVGRLGRGSKLFPIFCSFFW